MGLSRVRGQSRVVHADVIQDLCFFLYLAHCAARPQLSRRFLAWVFAGLRCGVSRDLRTRRRDDISFRLSCVHAAQTVQTGGDGRLKHEQCLASPSALQLGSSAADFQGSKLGNPLTPCSTRACLCFVRHPPSSLREKNDRPELALALPLRLDSCYRNPGYGLPIQGCPSLYFVSRLHIASLQRYIRCAKVLT